MTKSPHIAAKRFEMLRADGSRSRRTATYRRRRGRGLPGLRRRVVTLAARAAALAACIVAVPASTAHADTSGGIHPPGLPCGYTVEVIEGPEHPTWGWPALVYPQGLNEHGHATGYYKYPLGGNEVGFYWTPQDGLESIEPPKGVTRLRAYDLNNQNVIVGEYKHGSEPWRGFVYDTNTGVWTELEPVDPTGSGTASANAINNAGVVAGTRSIGETYQPYNAFIWSADDGYTDLGVMEGPNSAANGINAEGNVAGYSGHPGAEGQQAFIYIRADEALELLGPLPKGTTSVGYDLTDNNIVVANGLMDPDQTLEYVAQGAIWKNGEWILQGLAEDCIGGGPISINESEQVVGRCGVIGDLYGYTGINGVNISLAELVDMDGVAFSNARVINNAGQITARGSTSKSSNVGFLLTPVETPLGDLSGDCEVGAEDLGLLLSEWGKSDSPADLTGDRTVGGADLGVLLSNWTMK